MKTFNWLISVSASVLLFAGCSQPAPPANDGVTSDPARAVTVAATPTAAAAASDEPSEKNASPASSATSGPVADAKKSTQVDESIDQLLGDHASYHKVFDDLKTAVAAQDAVGVAALVSYPITVDIDGKKQVVRNSTEFKGSYAKFMTPTIAKAIIATHWSDVMVNAQGVMLGSGEAWINGICKDAACKNSSVKVVTLQSGADL